MSDKHHSPNRPHQKSLLRGKLQWFSNYRQELGTLNGNTPVVFGRDLRSQDSITLISEDDTAPLSCILKVI